MRSQWWLHQDWTILCCPPGLSVLVVQGHLSGEAGLELPGCAVWAGWGGEWAWNAGEGKRGMQLATELRWVGIRWAGIRQTQSHTRDWRLLAGPLGSWDKTLRSWRALRILCALRPGGSPWPEIVWASGYWHTPPTNPQPSCLEPAEADVWANHDLGNGPVNLGRFCHLRERFLTGLFFLFFLWDILLKVKIKEVVSSDQALANYNGWPNLASGLFSMPPQAKDGFYIFKGLLKNAHKN